MNSKGVTKTPGKASKGTKTPKKRLKKSVLCKTSKEVKRLLSLYYYLKIKHDENDFS